METCRSERWRRACSPLWSSRWLASLGPLCSCYQKPCRCGGENVIMWKDRNKECWNNLKNSALPSCTVTHLENVLLCLISRWEGTHLGMTSSPPSSLSASLRHTASWVSRIYRNRKYSKNSLLSIWPQNEIKNRVCFYTFSKQRGKTIVVMGWTEVRLKV